jgi:hypothetical protein
MRKMRMMAVAVTAAAMTMALAASAQASITIGQLAPTGAPPVCDLQFDDLQFINSTGAGYEVTDDGVLTSWSTNNTSPVPGQQITFKLFRSTGEPGQYKVLAHDGPHPLVPGINTFKVNIPVIGGEVIGLNTANASPAIPNVCEFNAGDTTNDRNFAYLGNGADGSVIGPQKGVGEAFRVNVSATFFQTPEISLDGRVKLGSIAGGGRVTLEGLHIEEVSKVTFGGVPATSFKVLDDHHVSAVVPRGKTLKGIAAAVTTPGGTATSNPLLFYSGCQVPKLTGKTLRAAKSSLKGAGCKLGRVSKVRGRHGKVVKQSPRPGKVLAPGAKVSVKVGR